MAVVTGQTVTSPTQGQVLVEQTFPTPGPVRLTLLISATYNFDALFEVWDGAGRVVYDLVLPIAAPLWTSPELGPFNLDRNGRLRVVSRNTPVTPGPLEVQATLTWRPWAER